MDDFYFTPRLFCDILEEMRVCFKTYNFAPIPSLIEEIQIIGNRMESGLEANKTLAQLADDISDEKKELRLLKAQIKEAGDVQQTT